MGGRWPYTYCFVGCYLLDLFITVPSILVELPLSFFSICLVSIHVVHPYSSFDISVAWKNMRVILSDRSDFQMNDSLSIAFYAFASHVLISFSVDETLLPIYHHHHHVVPLARIHLTLSCHFSLSFIVSGWSSGLHPVSSHSCCMYVLAGRPAFAWPYAGVHRSTSLMSSSLLLEQCTACLVRLAWTVFVMGGRWPYSWCLVGCVAARTCSILLATFLCNYRPASSPAL